jgi:hypothetical protein
MRAAGIENMANVAQLFSIMGKASSHLEENSTFGGPVVLHHVPMHWMTVSLADGGNGLRGTSRQTHSTTITCLRNKQL